MNSSASETNGRDLHLLSIEGRGICGLTALIILKEVLRQYQYLQKLPQLPRPCDIFDLAGGSGTGGLIAIMLFRLGMTVDEAIAAFKGLSKDVFSKRTVLSRKQSNASQLENAVAKVIHSALGMDDSQAQQIRLLADRGPKCFVIASTAKNLSLPSLFRTYIPPRHSNLNCTIVEAIRATTAEEPFFPSIEIGDEGLKESFIHGGSRLNNPLKSLLKESVSIFPGRCVSCVLSIGSGSQGIIGFETMSTTGLTKVLKKVLHDGESISEEVAKELSDKGVFYCRLNVDQGLEYIRFDDWERLGDVKTHTHKYLALCHVERRVDQLVQVFNQRIAIRITAEETLQALSKYLDGLTSMFPGESWNTVISEFIRIVKPSKTAPETLNMQSALLRDTLESCIQGRDLSVLPDELRENIQRLLEGLKRTFEDLRRQTDTQEEALAHLNMDIQKLLQQFWFKNHIAGNITVHDILKYIQSDELMKKSFTRLDQHAMNQNLSSLNVSPFAVYNSSEASKRDSCFKGTRVRLLNEIASWIAADDPEVPPIYVLDGVAGIGKSAVAQTVAEHAAGINALGASFFFSSNDDKRKTATTFFPTIAYQLAYYSKNFADKINEALLHTPHAVTQLPLTQFSTLIMDPLKELFEVLQNPILVVVDALDECKHDGDALLKIFAESIKNMPRLKLFITTRPEHHIRRVLDRYHHLQRFHLQDIEKSVVQSDMRFYLDHHLSEKQVQDQLPDLGYAWKPAEKEMEMLIGICGTLFILAATAVKFIIDSRRSNPGEQLSRLLRGVSPRDFSGSKYTTSMDSFYKQILLSAVPDDDDNDDWFGRYQVVVGTILALQYPLPCLALSALAGLVPNDVKRALSHLHSLVAPTGQELTFRIHHKSFPDFVTKSSRCERKFLIDLRTRHLELGKRCLMIMDSHLKPNICNLGLADQFKDNQDTQYLTQDCISQELAYASTHWATHLVEASKLDSRAEQLLEDFAHKHVLAWLEVLSIIGRVGTAYSSLGGIGKLLSRSNCRSGLTPEIFRDGCRFITLNTKNFKVAAGHVFSAIAFVPQDTALFRTYGGSKEVKLKVLSGFEKRWSPTISVAKHIGSVKLVTFSGSGDETKLASASVDETVRVWDGQTGAEIMVLRGHSNVVNSVVFSPDATKLASASGDGTVRLWDSQTGIEIAVLRWHSEWVNSVEFSPDGTKLASASRDGTVRLLDGQTGAEITVLQGHWDWVNKVVFSPDGTTLASASYDKTVRLWDGQTGAMIAVLHGHSKQFHPVAFSPDGTKLATASIDKTLRLWDSRTGTKISVSPEHGHKLTSVAFSPDSKKLASASDTEVRLWDNQTGEEIIVLRGHSEVNSAIFSPDGTQLASAYNDGTVRVWDVQTGAEIAVLRGSSQANSVAFSSDGTKLAAGYNDGTVRLWDSQTITQIAVLKSAEDSTRRLFPYTFEGAQQVMFSPDGMRMTSASWNGTVRLWDSQTGAEISVFQLGGHSNLISSVVISPDSTKLASLSYMSVGLWDGQSGAELAVLNSGKPRAVVFSPDSTKLASVSDYEPMQLWDGRTGNIIATLKGYSRDINMVVFSPDGTKVASAFYDRTIRLWDGQTGDELTVLRGHLHRINSMVFSPDGTKLAVVSDDGIVRLWDGHGRTCGRFRGFQFVAFTVDGSRLLSMDVAEIYQVDFTTGDKLAVRGTFIHSIVQSVQLPGSNLWVILVKRGLLGLLVVGVDDTGALRFRSLCWFPPDLLVISIAVSSCSRVAIGCQDGRVLLLDVDFGPLL